MAEEKIWRDAVFGPLQLGECHPEVGTGLGRLYDVRQVETGRAALLLLLGGELGWRLDGPWQARLSIDPVRSSVTLLVEESPPSANASELTDAFVLVSAALQEVEDSARFQAHLKSGVVGARNARVFPAHRHGLAGLALAGAAMIVMSVGLWLHRTGSAWLNPAPWEVSRWRPAPALAKEEASSAALPAYPLPETPFDDQTKAASCTKRGVVKINGGCWVELAQKPPCNEDEAEYQGKCYLPVGKRERLPQSAQP